jgi:hypothetical protein
MQAGCKEFWFSGCKGVASKAYMAYTCDQQMTASVRRDWFLTTGSQVDMQVFPRVTPIDIRHMPMPLIPTNADYYHPMLTHSQPDDST